MKAAPWATSRRRSFDLLPDVGEPGADPLAHPARVGLGVGQRAGGQQDPGDQVEGDRVEQQRRLDAEAGDDQAGDRRARPRRRR